MPPACNHPIAAQLVAMFMRRSWYLAAKYASRLTPRITLPVLSEAKGCLRPSITPEIRDLQQAFNSQIRHRTISMAAGDFRLGLPAHRDRIVKVLKTHNPWSYVHTALQHLLISNRS